MAARRLTSPTILLTYLTYADADADADARPGQARWIRRWPSNRSAAAPVERETRPWGWEESHRQGNRRIQAKH